MFVKQFKGKGLLKSAVGYIGGNTDNPSYRQVCSGSTGHAEAVRLEYDPSQLSYAELLEFNYAMHDPTTLNRQGNDRGTQYRSGVFAETDEHLEIAKKVTAEVQEQHFSGKPIVTQLLGPKDGPFKWWDAEDYHQQCECAQTIVSDLADLDQNPGGYECSAHVRPHTASR